MKKIILLLLISISLFADEKKEIRIPFPDSINLEKEELIKKETGFEKKSTITIQFPNDSIKEKKNTDVEFKELGKEKNSISKDSLPLQKLLILPEEENSLLENKIETINENKKNNVNENSFKEVSNSKEIKEAKISNLSSKDQSKEIKKEEPKESRLKKTLTENKPKDIRANSKLNPLNAEENISKKDNTKVALPNQSPKSKAKTVKEDESIPPYERSKYQINRDNIPDANPDLSLTANSGGIKSNPAKFDQIRLLSIERKKSEALAVIDSIEDLENKMKAYYELAIGLENSAKNNKKLMAESIPYFLKIITESPKENQLLPKTLWAISQLHFKIDEPTQGLDHLSNLILNYKNSEFIDDAIYLSARIYEDVPSIRNLDRAKKYYSIFLKNQDKPYFKNSIYLPFIKSRSERFNLE